MPVVDLGGMASTDSAIISTPLSHLRAAARLLGFAALAAAVMPAQALVAGPLFRDYKTLPRLLHRGLCRLLGLRVAFNGVAPVTDKPMIYVANHMSHMDTAVLNSVFSATFVGKKEIRDWPVVGWFGRRIGTIFINRAPGALRGAMGQVAEALNRGENVAFFPEATTSSGADVLKFKRGLLSVAFNNISRVPLKQETGVQPFSMRVSQVNGHPAGPGDQKLRDIFAWHGDTSLVTHFWTFLRQKEVRIQVTGFPEIKAGHCRDSREFAKAAEKAVRSGLWAEKPGL